MATKLLLALIVGLAAASGLYLDPNLGDGIYSVIPDPPSQDGHILKRHSTLACEGAHCFSLRDIFDHAPPGPTQLEEHLPIPRGKDFCRKGENSKFKVEDYHAAVNALFESSLFWVPPEHITFALHGTVVAYICNLDYWNSGSLAEYMSAMARIDQKCGEDVAGKSALGEWNKFYGRETLGRKICKWETAPGGLKGDLLKWEKKCKSYVSDIHRALGEKGKCNDNASVGVLERLKKMTPWYKEEWQKKPEDENDPEDDESI